MAFLIINHLIIPKSNHLSIVHFSKYDIECLEKAKSIIDNDLQIHINIEFLAEKAGIGQTKLKTAFKKYYGSGIFTYLRKKRMKRAAALIIDTDKAIKEISRIAGFKYYTNFSIAFKTFHGITPAKYRAKFRRK